MTVLLVSMPNAKGDLSGDPGSDQREPHPGCWACRAEPSAATWSRSTGLSSAKGSEPQVHFHLEFETLISRILCYPVI